MADTELISEGAQAFGRGKRSNSEEMIGVGEGPEDGKATSI